MRRYAVLLLRLAAMPLTSLADWLEEPDPRLWAVEDVPRLVEEISRLRRGLHQIIESSYPADAGEAEVWAEEILTRPESVWEADQANQEAGET